MHGGNHVTRVDRALERIGRVHCSNVGNLRDIQQRGNTILLATHDPIVREHVKATRELHLENGRLIDNVVTPHLRAITDPEIDIELPEEEPIAPEAEVAEPGSGTPLPVGTPVALGGRRRRIGVVA